MGRWAGRGWAGEMQQQYITEDFREHAEQMMHNVGHEEWLRALGPASRLESLLGCCTYTVILDRTYITPNAGGQECCNCLDSEGQQPVTALGWACRVS